MAKSVFLKEKIRAVYRLWYMYDTIIEVQKEEI